MSDYSQMTDGELSAAMDEMDAALEQPCEGVTLRIAGFMAPGTPHEEYFKRSVLRSFHAN